MPLAFPSVALSQEYPNDSASNGGYYTNEDSDVGTPFSPPAHGLQEMVIDPALLGDAETEQTSQPTHYPPEPIEQYHPEQYDLSHLHQPYPNGEPFGDPHLPPHPFPRYFPSDPNGYSPYFGESSHPYAAQHPPIPSFAPISPVKSAKRPRKRRRPPREDSCSFCKGSDLKNKKGEVETMVTCCNCGRSGHPSCLQIEQIGSIIMNYEWMCQECKTCEICNKKGREDAFLFCDLCDRGWHTYCLTPQLQEPPTGTWACPKCSQPAEGSSTIRRSSSVASSSRLPPDPPPPNGQANGKVRDTESLATPIDDVEPNDFSLAEPISSVKGRPKKASHKRSRNRNRTPEPESPAVDHIPLPPSPSRSISQRAATSAVPRVRLKLSKGKGKAKGKATANGDDDDHALDPFDGILQGSAGDTSKTTITLDDKARFESAKVTAESKLGPANTIVQPFSTPSGTPGPKHPPLGRTDSVDPESIPQGVRPLRSLTSQTHLHLHDTGAASSRLGTTPDKGKGKCPPGGSTPTKTGPGGTSALRIRAIRFGDFEIDTWYDAPFPEEYASVPDGMLWICEFCLKYMKSRFSAGRHRLKCKVRHPPGDEIYRDDGMSVFEVDGRKNKIYCQNLCLLSKMFLDHKSLFYDVEPFLFYVMTEVDDVGARFIGYFSKEKRSAKEYNLSCIMTLPVRQKRGWGNLLIDFSYLLSKKEGRIGGPETPLSALGAITYKRYWTLSLMYYFRNDPQDVTLPGISAETSITIEDIYATLQANDMIITYDDTASTRNMDGATRATSSIRNHRTSRPGRNSLPHGVARRNVARKAGRHASHTSDETPVRQSIPRRYRIKWDKESVARYVQNWENRRYLRLKPERLKWSPFLLARSQEVDEAIEGGPSSETTDVLVATMVRRAEEEAVRLKRELEEMEIEMEVNGHDLEDVPQEEDEGEEEYRSRTRVRPPNGFIPTKAPRNRPASVAASIIRTRSSRDLLDSASRESRSRAGSRSGADEAADGSLVRSSRRLRLRRSVGSSSRSLAMVALRKRKHGHDTSSEEDDEEEETPRKRLSRRTTASSRVTGDNSDDGGAPDSSDEPPTPTPRVLRSSRNNTVNGASSTKSPMHLKSSTPSESPRKRRRIESPSEVNSEPEVDSPRPTRRRGSPPHRNDTKEEVTPVKKRLRTRRLSPSPTDIPTRRQSRRKSTTKQKAKDEEPDEVEEEHEYKANGTANGRALRTIDFESTGSLSSVGTEPREASPEIKEEEPVASAPASTAATLSAPPGTVDALVLLAEAADYVHGGSQEELEGSIPEMHEGDAEEDDAEGEEAWD